LHDKFISLIHVDDLVEGILQAGSNPSAIGRTYFLASERPYRYHDIGETIGRVLGCHPRCIRLPHAAVYCIGAIMGGLGKLTRQQVFFNLSKAREATQPGWVCSVERAKGELGFRQRVELEEGMRKTCTWYREQGWLS
jgi:nucleoside-diphosphate-sugar epimerase